jgi:uncharacterized repeat protein (TIGR03803 family)
MLLDRHMIATGIRRQTKGGFSLRDLKLIQSALLGTALALIALAPASGASMSRHDLNRIRALHGKHSAGLRERGSASAQNATEATYTDLHDFTGDDGFGTGANVTLDDSGNIYGTTDFGGAHDHGVVFKLAPDGTQTVLHSFIGSEGSEPDGAVSLVHGNLFGTAGSGGASGNGVLFKLNKNGRYKDLHDFSATDGSFLRGNLTRDKLGNFYGTALFGGANDDGTVYKYGFDGSFTVLHAFNGGDGEYPEHGVVRDSAGNLYGVTAFGGADDEGSVYKVASDGTFTSLYSFSGGADGGFLYGGLALDDAGNLYGSTVEGGSSDQGTVFKLAPDGTLTTLYNFTGGADGGSPEGDMTRVGPRLFSTASEGGDPSCQCGVIYELKPNGKELVLHTFTGSDGGGYSAGLTKHAGVFYGATASGGANDDGVVFSLKK